MAMLTELNAYVLNFLVKKTTDTIFKNSPVFKRLSSRNRTDFPGGLAIQRPFIMGYLNGGAVGRGEGFDLSFVTTDAALVDYMKLYGVNISLYGFDSMTNEGQASAFSQVELKFQNAALTMTQLLATDMYLDNTTAGRSKCLTGFPMWYDDGNTYATVAGCTRSQIMTVGTVGGLNAYTATLTSFTLKQLNSAYGQAWFGADHIDMLACTQNGYNLVWEAVQPLQRYTDASASDVAQAGFEAFRFNAAEVVVDKYMPTGTNGVMYGINSKYIEWYFSNNPLFKWGWTGFKGAQGSIDVAGQFLVGNQIMVVNPRTGFKLLSTLF